MAEEELDLLQLASGSMAQAGTGTAKIVRSQSLNVCSLSSPSDDPPDKLLADSWTPYCSCAAYAPEDGAFRDGSRGHPPIQSVLDPIWNRHRADVSSFAIESGDGLVLITLLQVPQGEAR